MLDSLYDYQKEAVNAALSTNIGTVVLPTGTGKTFCQAAIVASDIINSKEKGFYVVNCPRILLSFQLLKEIYFFLTAAGIDARYMFVHSGGANDVAEMEQIRKRANKLNSGGKVKFAQIEASTSSNDIEEMMMKSRKQGLPLVIFSTYHSCPRVETARQKTGQNIRMMLNDEAHYLTQEEFHKILSTVQSERRYFFTATARFTPSDEGRGMNNSEKFGEIVYSMTPREAIELGKMVRPRIHQFFSPSMNSFDDFQKSIPKIISSAFFHHAEVLKKYNQKAKILVSTKGVGDIKNFLDSKEYSDLRKEGVDIFAVASSDQVGNRINEETVSRKDFLKKLKLSGENQEKRIIVLHYDILAEGIDVSGFTGILPLRTLSKSKFLQTLGRAARLHPDDRKAFDTGEYKPSNVNKLKKPYAYILAPNVAEGNEDDYENLCRLVYQMREFDFSCLEHIITSEEKNGIIEESEVDGLNDIDANLSGMMGKIIEKIQSEIEEESIASLSPMGRVRRTIRKSRDQKALKSKKKRITVGFNVYSSREEIKEKEGSSSGYCVTVSKNSVNDVALAILNKAGVTNLNNHYFVDKANEYYKGSWSELMEIHPEFEGKYIMPVYEYK